jgi:hypothetical protein
MECGDSDPVGWFMIGMATGLFSYTFLSGMFPQFFLRKKPATVIHYIPIAVTDLDDDNEPIVESDPDIQMTSSGESDTDDDSDTEEYQIHDQELDTEEQINTFKKGDYVVVKLPDGQDEPSFGWGGVGKDDVGIVVSSATEYFRDKLCYRVDFPNHPYWLALASEICHHMDEA